MIKITAQRDMIAMTKKLVSLLSEEEYQEIMAIYTKAVDRALAEAENKEPE